MNHAHCEKKLKKDSAQAKKLKNMRNGKSARNALGNEQIAKK
jgi:hypothetical protein